MDDTTNIQYTLYAIHPVEPRRQLCSGSFYEMMSYCTKMDHDFWEIDKETENGSELIARSATAPKP